MAAFQNLLNPSLKGLEQLPDREIVSNEVNLGVISAFAKSAESTKSPEKLLELETFLRGLYYGLESGLTDEDKNKLVERVVQPLMRDPSWTQFYSQAKNGANGSLAERSGAFSSAGGSSLIGVIPYIIDDYTYIRGQNPHLQSASKNAAPTLLNQLHTS